MIPLLFFLVVFVIFFSDVSLFFACFEEVPDGISPLND